jgi:hypothetical protein
MIVNHHGGGLIGHVTTAPCLSYKWHDVPAWFYDCDCYLHNTAWLAFINNHFANTVHLNQGNPVRAISISSFRTSNAVCENSRANDPI